MSDNFFRLSSLVYIIGLAVWAYKIAPQDAGQIVCAVIAATLLIIASGGSVVASSLEVDLFVGLTTGTIFLLSHTTPYIPWWPRSVFLSFVLTGLVSEGFSALYVGLLRGIEKVFSLFMKHLASKCN